MGDLEIQQDLDFQQRAWRVQRIGWWVILIFVFCFLLVILRVAGKRSLAQITTFDLVLTLIVSEAVQEALIEADRSLTNSVLVVMTLVGLDILLSIVKQRSTRIEKLLDGVPLVIVEDGKLLRDRMDKERVDEGDILNAARERQGLMSLVQVRSAVIERSGGISVVPKEAK